MSITDLGAINASSIQILSSVLQETVTPVYTPYSSFLNRYKTLRLDSSIRTEVQKNILPNAYGSFREIQVLVTENSVPVSRTVRLYNSADGSLVQTRISDTNGRAVFEWLDSGLNYFLVAFDSDGAPVRNAVIFDRIQARTSQNKFVVGGSDSDYTYTLSNMGTTLVRSTANYFDFTESSILNFNRTLVDLCGKVWFGGNMQFDNSPRFGTGAMLFNGTTTTVASTPSQDYNFGTGDFCIQFWIKTSTDYSASAGLARIFCPDKTVNPAGGLQIVVGNGSFGTTANRVALQGPSVAIITTTTPVNDGLWHHIAVTRQSGTARIFFDGQLQGSVVDNTNYTTFATEGIRMGCRSDRNVTTFFTGSIDSVEISRGAPVYTSNFTIPATEFTRSVGTTAIGFARTQDRVDVVGAKINYQFSLSAAASVRIGFTKGIVDSPLQLLGSGSNSWAVAASTTGNGSMISNGITIPSTPTVPQVNLTTYEYLATSYSQSSSYTGNLIATTTNMRDSNFSTGAATNNGASEFIAMDLGDSRNVSRIAIGASSNLPEWGPVSLYLNGRVIQYSNDNTNWTTALTITNVTDTNQTFNFDLPFPVQARYWRVTAPSGSSSNWLSLTEFRAFGLQDRAVNILVDWTNGRVWTAVNGVYTNGAANPDAGTGFDFTIPFDVPMFIAASVNGVGESVTIRQPAQTWSLPNTSQFTYSALRP